MSQASARSGATLSSQTNLPALSFHHRPPLPGDAAGAGQIWRFIRQSEIGQQMEWGGPEDEEGAEQGEEGGVAAKAAGSKKQRRKGARDSGAELGGTWGAVSWAGCGAKLV